jgi:hypothetical protein
MRDTRDTHQTQDNDPSATNPSGRLSTVWRKVLALFVLVDIVGAWVLMVQIISRTPARAVTFRSAVFIATVLFTAIGVVVSRYLLPGMITRVVKKLVLTLAVVIIAIYVFYPAIEYFRGDDDIYLASMVLNDGRKLQDAQKIAATLKVLSMNQKTYRVELSKRDYTRLRRRSYRVVLLQNPEQQYRMKQINARTPGAPNGTIDQMIHAVSSDSLMKQVRMLERYGSRMDGSPQADSAADYIANVMRQYGLDVESQSFVSPGPRYLSPDGAALPLMSRNVCGTLRGAGPSDAECIIVGHYDSVSPMVPGANDNASGVAAVLEAARICSQYRFEYTIRFLAVGAEEVGLVGSEHYAQDAKAKGRHIVVAVNGDMLGYPIVGDVNRIYFSAGTKCAALMDSALVYNRRYHLNLLVDGQIGGVGGSDHESFLEAGYPAVDVCEGTAFEIWRGMDPYYHSPFDTSDKISPELLRHCTQLMMAITTEMAKPLTSTAARKP